MCCIDFESRDFEHKIGLVDQEKVKLFTTIPNRQTWKQLQLDVLSWTQLFGTNHSVSWTWLCPEQLKCNYSLEHWSFILGFHIGFGWKFTARYWRTIAELLHQNIQNIPSIFRRSSIECSRLDLDMRLLRKPHRWWRDIGHYFSDFYVRHFKWNL